jgi:hypothetical protein
VPCHDARFSMNFCELIWRVDWSLAWFVGLVGWSLAGMMLYTVALHGNAGRDEWDWYADAFSKLDRQEPIFGKYVHVQFNVCSDDLLLEMHKSVWIWTWRRRVLGGFSQGGFLNMGQICLCICPYPSYWNKTCSRVAKTWQTTGYDISSTLAPLHDTIYNIYYKETEFGS